MKLHYCIVLLCFISNFAFAQESSDLCNKDRQSRLEVRLGGNERFIKDPIIPEYNSLTGFSPSVHLSLPFKISTSNYLQFKLIFGGSINNLNFNEVVNGSAVDNNISSRREIYSNTYVGVGLGKGFTLFEKENSFMRIPLSLNLIYIPTVEIISDGFIEVPLRNYEVDSTANYDDETNFSIVPEISAEYHFLSNGCTSFSIGLYYSRGINTVYEGEVRIRRADGEEFEQSYSKPFNSFGISFGYGIFRAKK